MAQKRRRKENEKLDKIFYTFVNRAHLNSYGFIELTGIEAKRIIVIGENFGVVNDVDCVSLPDNSRNYLCKPILFADKMNDHFWKNKPNKKELYLEISDLILDTEDWPFILISCYDKVSEYVRSTCTLEMEINSEILNLLKLNSSKTEFWFCQEKEIIEKNPVISTYVESKDSKISFGLNILKRKTNYDIN